MPSPHRTAWRFGAGVTLIAAAALTAWPVPAPHALASQAEPESEAAVADTLERLAEKAMAAVALINVETPTGSRQGSGFIVDSNGVLLTNFHVMRDAVRARVKLPSGDVFDRVVILASDQRRDIAVLEIQGFGLPTLPLGNSDSVRVGSPAMVISSPLGLQNTVSTGIVSGRREQPDGYHLIQITAPSSPGSSGGPVLSRRGEVIGLAVSQMRNGQNLNFAVPINYARGLLAHLDDEPVAVLGPGTSPSPLDNSERLATGDKAVNRGIPLDYKGFTGYRVEMKGQLGTDRSRRSRIVYRRIETVGGGEPRIERYVESETTQEAGPFGTPQTILRERSRTLVFVEGLRPLSARGEVAWWTDEGWRKTTYDMRFEGYRVRGTIVDTIGNKREIDQELPPGVVLREMRDLAFSSLAADSLTGRSVEIITFDPLAAELATDRYDVRQATRIEAAGASHEVLTVEMATGLANSTAYFGAKPPHVVFRREEEDEAVVEEVVHLELFPPAGGRKR